jgi:hypothetical protein
MVPGTEINMRHLYYFRPEGELQLQRGNAESGPYPKDFDPIASDLADRAHGAGPARTDPNGKAVRPPSLASKRRPPSGGPSPAKGTSG